MRSDLSVEGASPIAPLRATRLPQAVAVLVALVFAITFAASSASISQELHHDCTGDGCAVCAEMAGGMHLARVGFSLPGAPAALAALMPLPAFPVLGALSRRMNLTTLVSLKVQLND